MNPASHSVLAHQGGWDEVLLVGVPLIVIGLLLWLANRRVSRRLAEESSPGEVTPTDQPPTQRADEHTT